MFFVNVLVSKNLKCKCSDIFHYQKLIISRNGYLSYYQQLLVDKHRRQSLFFFIIIINRNSMVIFFKNFDFVERCGKTDTRKVIFFFQRFIIISKFIFMFSCYVSRENCPLKILFILILWVYYYYFYFYF